MRSLIIVKVEITSETKTSGSGTVIFIETPPLRGLAHIPADTYPSLDDGQLRWRERHVVSGFFFSSTGIGLIGRFSSRRVVNVSQGGGLLPALWVH